jgi:hypothetical protein
VVPRAIYVAMLAEQNQQRVLHWKLRYGTTRGGVKFLPTFPFETARAPSFCYMSPFAKKSLGPFPVGR